MLTVPAKFDRGAYRDEAKSVEGAVWLLGHVARLLGQEDLSDTDVLDVGCGVKFTQAVLNHVLPIGSYFGIDVHEGLIEFLTQEVDDPRFAYHRLHVRNELYNPVGPPMTEHTDLGVGDRTFDLVCLFSVFTHLSPSDYVTMLKLLRRHVRPDGRLVFTLFVDELTKDGWGFIDAIARSVQEEPAQPKSGTDMESERSVAPFVDVDSTRPLMWALYSREFATELIAGTGWEPIELLPPNQYAQHQFLCAPV